MSDKDAVIATICKAFEQTEYPGDAFLLGSSEGCEPLEEVGPFGDGRTGKASSRISWMPTGGLVLLLGRRLPVLPAGLSRGGSAGQLSRRSRSST